MTKQIEAEWEIIEERAGGDAQYRTNWGGQTARLAIPGGYLYRVQEWTAEHDNMCICFVPAPPPTTK